MIQKILDDTTSEPSPGERHLAALTAADRVTWAKTRKSFFSTGVNRSSLDTVERVSSSPLPNAHLLTKISSLFPLIIRCYFLWLFSGNTEQNRNHYLISN